VVVMRSDMGADVAIPENRASAPFSSAKAIVG